RCTTRFGLVPACLVALALSAGCKRRPEPPVIDPVDVPPATHKAGPPAVADAGPAAAPLQDLGSDDAEARRRAAEKLGQLGAAAAAPQLARRVGDDTFATPEEKLAALNALKALAPELLDEALWNALRARNPRVRAWALEEMKRRDADDSLNDTVA